MKPRACQLMLILVFGLSVSLACGQGNGVVEGTVALPKPSSRATPLPRYPGQLIQPTAPDPPTAVVYLEGAPETPLPGPGPVVQLRQRGLQFRPALLPVLAGTTIEFPNEDELYHSVFSYSKPKRFDLGRYRKNEQAAAQRFDKPGLVKLNCEIHPHMRGYILVLTNPHFARTDTNGHYRLPQLPAGTHTLKAWLDEGTTLTRRVEVKADETVRVDFRLGAPGT